MRRRFLGAMTALLLSYPGFSGQMGGHDYIASKSIGYLSGTARIIVDSNMDAYLTGAQGPDICGVVMPKLNKASWFTAIGEETHYSPQKAELALNLLDSARNDREKAYAIGWISHYIDDIFVHTAVNNYGGFYEQFPTQHKVLEQLESKHVYAKHGDVVTENLSLTLPKDFGAFFPEFIFDAYQKTYPDNSIYKSGEEWFVENKPYFCDRYNEAAGWCKAASEEFYKSHKNGSGLHSWALATTPFPNMPAGKAYENMFKALEIKEIKTEPQSITVTANINDSKLYGRFLVDWDAAADSAISYSNQVYRLLSQYLDEKDPATKADLRKQLLEVVPNENLDQPHPTFDYAQAKPGDFNATRLHYLLTITKQGEQDQLTTVEGQSDPILYKTPMGEMQVYENMMATFAGSKLGQVKFDITVPEGSSPYKFKLQLSLSGSEAFDKPEYKNVDWVVAEGEHPGNWMTGGGQVAVSEFFTVRMPVPAEIAKKEASRRYVIMPQGADLKYEDLALIQSRLGNDKYRYDVTALEEKIEGSDLVATLQVTNDNPYAQKLLGANKLTMIWFDKGKGEMDVSGVLNDMTKELDAANKALEESQKAMDAIGTAEQQAQVEEAMMKYSEDLEKQGVSEEQKGKLLEARALEEMKKAGMDPKMIEKNNEQDLEIANKLSESMRLPFNVSTDIDLAAMDLKFDLPADWSASATYGADLKFQNLRSADYKTERKDSAGNPMWDVSANFSAELTEDEDFAKIIRQRMPAGSTMSIAGFTGPVGSTAKDGSENAPFSRTISGEGLLQKGKVYLHISYGVYAHGYKIYETNGEKQILIYDGTDDAQQIADKLKSDAAAMAGGVRLYPVR
jgi:hypothetical protein